MIRVTFADFWPNFNHEEMTVFRELSKKYKLILSDNPDVVFASVFGMSSLNYGAPIIAIGGEKYFYNWQVTKAYISAKYSFPHASYFPYTCLFCRPDIYEKRINNNPTKFASFVVGNGNVGDCTQLRVKLFLSLQTEALKKGLNIESCGNVYRNTQEKAPYPAKEYEGLHLDPVWLSKYKFNICCENSLYPGYLTEKVVQALIAGCIPISLTHESNMTILNPKAGIYGHGESDIPTMISRVINMTEDEYQQMKTEPPFLIDMKTLTQNFHALFISDVEKILKSNIEKSLKDIKILSIPEINLEINEQDILDIFKKVYSIYLNVLPFGIIFTNRDLTSSLPNIINKIKEIGPQLYFLAIDYLLSESNRNIEENLNKTEINSVEECGLITNKQVNISKIIQLKSFWISMPAMKLIIDKGTIGVLDQVFLI